MFLRDEQQRFWEAVRSGISTVDAAALIGAGEVSGRTWMRHRGGVIPQHLLREISPRFLSPMDRSLIVAGRAQGLSIRRIAVLVRKSPSTVSRELRRNRRGDHCYDAHVAQVRAERRRSRPRPSKLAMDEPLRQFAQKGLDQKWSPTQISQRLVEQFPGDERMRVSHETIYQAIYVQARGSLKRDIEARVRTGRTLRKPRNQRGSDKRRQGPIRDMIMISDRPASIEDRAIPGHWEGDLIIGKDNGSQIGTLVERTTRYCLLLHLPADRTPETVANAMIEKIRTLPEQLIRSITWDQGVEMAGHKKITFATEVDIYFCDPHSPWQRGTNENTNGLLRQYFPKGTDLSIHSAERLDAVAIELNGRPRQTLNWKTPAEVLDQLFSTPQQPGVATTA